MRRRGPAGKINYPQAVVPQGLKDQEVPKNQRQEVAIPEILNFQTLKVNS